MPRRDDWAMSGRQCEIAAESYCASLLAQCGYDVLVQYGANQPNYDLIARKGPHRTLPISVKGSQDGGWMLAVNDISQRDAGTAIDYRAGIERWRKRQEPDVVFVLVQFMGVDFTLGQAPRVYAARADAIAEQLASQCAGRGHGSLQEHTKRHQPRSRYDDKLPAEWLFTRERIDSV